MQSLKLPDFSMRYPARLETSERAKELTGEDETSPHAGIVRTFRGIRAQHAAAISDERATSSVCQFELVIDEELTAISDATAVDEPARAALPHLHTALAGAAGAAQAASE